MLELIATVAFESFQVLCDSVFAIAEGRLASGDDGVFHTVRITETVLIDNEKGGLNRKWATYFLPSIFTEVSQGVKTWGQFAPGDLEIP